MHLLPRYEYRQIVNNAINLIDEFPGKIRYNKKR